MNLREMADEYAARPVPDTYGLSSYQVREFEAYLAGARAAIDLLRSEEAVWTDIEPRSLSDKDRGTSTQWADWLQSKIGDDK